MKVLSLCTLLAGFASTLPAATALPTLNIGDSLNAVENQLASLVRRATGTTSNELENGACRPIVLIFARGTNEPGNMGDSPGPRLCDGLKARYGASKVACQGVSAPYKAELAPNILPKGSTNAAFDEGARLFRLASSKCPSAKIVGGGYSQGGAVIHGAATRLSAAVRAKVVGLVTFGDSQAEEDGGKIPPFPASKVKIICNKGDIICQGGLIVTDAHTSYNPRVPEGTSFLISKIGSL